MDFCKRPKWHHYTFFGFRLIKHFIICTAGFCVGLSSEMFPTAKNVLQDRHSLTDFEVEAIQFAGSLGLILGVVAAGFIFHRFAKYTVLIVSINVLNVSASLFSIPWISQVHVLCLIHAGMGASGGFMVTAGNTGVTLLWRAYDATPWLNCLHLFVIMGSLVSRHNAIPYIKPSEKTIYSSYVLEDDVTNQNGSNTLADFECNATVSCEESQIFMNETDTRSVYSDDIVYHYSASGIFVFLFACTAFSLFMYGQPKGFPAGQKTTLCAHSSGLRSRTYTIYTISMLFGFFVFLFSSHAALEGIKHSFTNYDYPGNPDWEHISFYMYGIALARLISIFLTFFIPLKPYLLIDIIGIVILACIRCSIHEDTDTAVLTAFTGAFLGLTLPNAMALASHELHMNSIFVLVLLDANFSGILASKYLTEHILDVYSEDSLLFVIFSYDLVMLAGFIAMMLIINKMKPKSDKFVLPQSKDMELNGKHNAIYIVGIDRESKS